VQIDSAELHEFIERGLCAMTCLCQRAEMSESEIALRTMLVHEYFRTNGHGVFANLTNGGLETRHGN
jgi:hypothetical protein